MEEDDGYFTGETDPFRVEKSEQPIVVCPFEREETVDLPSWDTSVESTALCIKDKPERVLAAERDVDAASVVCVEPRTVLKGRPELYMFTDIFGDVGVLCAASDLSATEPLAEEEECTGEVRDVYADARLLMDVGSVGCLPGQPEDTRLADRWMGNWPCWTTVLMGDAIVL